MVLLGEWYWHGVAGICAFLAIIVHYINNDGELGMSF